MKDPVRMNRVRTHLILCFRQLTGHLVQTLVYAMSESRSDGVPLLFNKSETGIVQAGLA